MLLDDTKSNPSPEEAEPTRRLLEELEVGELSILPPQGTLAAGTPLWLTMTESRVRVMARWVHSLTGTAPIVPVHSNAALPSGEVPISTLTRVRDEGEVEL